MSAVNFLNKLAITAAGAVATLGILAPASHGAVLGIYTLDNTLSASSVNPNLTFSNFSYTGSATPTFFNDNNSPTGQAYAANNWSSNSTIGNFFSFTVNPQTGYQMTLDSIALDERRSSTGIHNWEIRSSLDNYTTSLASFNVPDNENWRSGQTANLSSLFANLNSAVEFRIYGNNAESSVGTWRLDDVKVNGSVAAVSTPGETAVPEPGTILGSLIVAGLGMTMKRKQK